MAEKIDLEASRSQDLSMLKFPDHHDGLDKTHLHGSEA